MMLRVNNLWLITLILLLHNVDNKSIEDCNANTIFEEDDYQIRSEITDDCKIANRSEANETLEENGTTSRKLSRRKRFLIFPDGSSFQLVFCVQTSALIPIGDIFLYGNTAALAWTLPSDPKFIYMLKDYDKMAERRSDIKHNIYYLDEKGKLVAKVPYKRPTIINPAFAKRSVDEEITFKEKLKMKIDRIKMHRTQLNREYLKREHMDNDSIEFHRSSRIGLFKKLETLFNALGQDGRQCVLYKLCESAQPGARQGTFLQEFLRIVFTFPKSNSMVNEEHKEYDEAHVITDDCAQRYSDCKDLAIPLQM